VNVSDRRLHFGVLGPLVVWTGDESARVGGTKQRLVLAALLLGHGRPVSTDQLVDTVWPDRPPRSAVAKRLQAGCTGRFRVYGANSVAGSVA
jgi:hypothetical protein